MYFIVNVANRYHAVIGGVYYEIVNIKTTQFCQPLYVAAHGVKKGRPREACAQAHVSTYSWVAYWG